MTTRYVYRYDSLNVLRRVLTDSHIRARRIRDITKEDFPHDEAKEALAIAPPQTGVFQISMWKNLEAGIPTMRLLTASAELGDTTNIPIYQRIDENHPFLSKFEKHDDQYLVNEAWIYTASVHIGDSNPDWSHDGIPYSDIESLGPDGSWGPLINAEFLTESTSTDWINRSIPPFLQSPNNPPITFCSTHVTIETDESRANWIVAKFDTRRSRTSTFHILNGGEQARLVSNLRATYKSIDEDARVLVVQIGDEGTVVHEIRLCRRESRESFLQKLIRRCKRLSKPPAEVLCHDVQMLTKDRASPILEATGLTNPTEEDARWIYSSKVLDQLTPAS